MTPQRRGAFGRCAFVGAYLGAYLGACLGLALVFAPGCGDGAPRTASGTGGRGTGGGAGPDPGSKVMHRLNATEYNATVADVLGTTLQPATGNWRGGEVGGFDNMAAVLGVDELQYGRYLDAAKTLATEVMASEQLRARFVGCDLNDHGCASASIARAGARLFRRPLDGDERQTYLRVYESSRELGDDGNAAFTLALQALLSSAEFLYRIELDPEPASPAAHRLGAYELASRLSYFLWSSAPDEALLDAAANGKLLSDDGLGDLVDRMLDDPRADRLATNFAGQWLGAREVLVHPVAPKFWQWSLRTAQAASQEIVFYFGDFLRSDRSWFEFPEADFNYVDGELAYFYDIPADVTGFGTFQRLENRTDRRAGFLGLAGFLAVTSLDRRTSPSRRGRWIASTLLCTEPPAPPPNVPELEREDGTDGAAATPANIRASLERHRRDPGCATCHALFDAYGLALEGFDAVGLPRTTYEDGVAINAAVTFPPSASYPDGLSFQGLDGLAHAVATNPNFGACLARKLFTYGLGRTLTSNDEPHLARARAAWLAPGQTPSIRRLIRALVATDGFRSRRAEDGPVMP